MFTFIKNAITSTCRIYDKGKKYLVAIGNFQLRHKARLKTTYSPSQPQRRSRLKAHAIWNENTLWTWSRQIPQRPFPAGAVSCQVCVVQQRVVQVTLQLPELQRLMTCCGSCRIWTAPGVLDASLSAITKNKKIKPGWSSCSRQIPIYLTSKWQIQQVQTQH